MGRTRYRVCVWMLIFLTGGAVFQGGSCLAFAAENALAATNFCFIIDCQNGFFGGLIAPCGSPLVSFDDILQDCSAPVVITTTQ